VEPIDVVFCKRDGRLTGEAFVVLSNPMHVDVALSKNRTYLGRRYVEIYRAKKQVGVGVGVTSSFATLSFLTRFLHSRVVLRQE
jgi:hypothetical protein